MESSPISVDQLSETTTSFRQAYQFIKLLEHGENVAFSWQRITEADATKEFCDKLQLHIPVIVSEIQKDNVDAWEALNQFFVFTNTNQQTPSEVRQELADMVVSVPHHIQDKIQQAKNTDSNLFYFRLLFNIRQLVVSSELPGESQVDIWSTTSDILHEHNTVFGEYIDQISLNREQKKAHTDLSQELDAYVLNSVSLLNSFIVFGEGEDRTERIRQLRSLLSQYPDIPRNYITDLLLMREETALELAGIYIEDDLEKALLPSIVGIGWLIAFSDGEADTEIQNAHWVVKNLAVVHDLLQKATDAPDVLFRMYGIEAFARYPVELLYQMYEDTLKPQKEEYILEILPRRDYNGAFCLQGDSTFLPFYEQVSAMGYKVKIIEAANIPELIYRAAWIQKRYGSASGLIVNGHGSPTSIALSGSYSFSSEEFAEKTGRILRHGLKRMLKPGAQILFASCSTGIDGGIAQKCSKEFGRIVLAPDTPTFYPQVRALQTHKGLQLEAIPNQGSVVVYKYGKKKDTISAVPKMRKRLI